MKWVRPVFTMSLKSLLFLATGRGSFFTPGNVTFTVSGVGRDVHGRGKGVVAALALVHVVVGLQHFLGIGELAALQHVRAVGHHFVHVHVALRATASLPDHQRELVVQLMCEDLVADLADQIALLLRKFDPVQGWPGRRPSSGMAKAWMISRGMLPGGPILKLLRLRSVCAPQYLSAGTFTSPIVSFSMR
jgi:hypothetical protein